MVDLGLDIRKGFKRFGSFRSCAEDVIHTHHVSESYSISKTVANTDFDISIWIMQIVKETMYLTSKIGLKVEDLAGPQLALLKDAKLKESDNTELSPPPLSAMHKSLFVSALALTISPFARTIL